MNDDRAFLAAVMANPRDRLLRLVYADWLDERGDPRGEFLRIQCLLEELPAGADERRQLQERADALQVGLSSDWVAALGGPIWCVATNAVLEHAYGPGGAETRRGTKHFAPGAKLYLVNFLGRDRVTVVGRHRKSNRYITTALRAAHLANWRAELVYAPAVLRQITMCGGFSGGGEESRKRAEEIATVYNQRGAVRQPFVTRTKSATPDAVADGGT